MAIFKTYKQLSYNVDGFHASHILNSVLSIAEIMPDRVKTDKDECLHLSIVNTIGVKDSILLEEKSSFISFDKKQLKELRNLIDTYLKQN